MTITLTYRCMPRRTISNDVLSVSCIQPQHIESIRQWRNAQMFALRQNSEISAQQQIQYYDEHIWPCLDSDQPATILLSICRNDTLIGYGGLVHIAWQDLRAEVSFLLKTELADSASEYSLIYRNYLELVCDFAFNDLRLNRLCTETYASLALHIRTLELSGFTREGEMKEHTIQRGVPTDSIIHGRLNPLNQ